MVDVTKLKEVANTDTAKEILNGFAALDKVETEIDLQKFRKTLLGYGSKVVLKEYMRFFRDLHELKFGQLILGRGASKDRFIPHYNLKDIANAVLNPTEFKEFKEITPPVAEVVSIKKRGRPVGWKKPKPAETAKPVPVNSSRHGLVFAFTKTDGEMMLLNLDEAEKISEQLKFIKSKLG